VGKAEDGDKSRNRLLEAAIELYARRGMGDTSVQEVAEAANLTKGAFYHHFDSKADLIKAAHERLIGENLAELREILESGLSPAEMVKEMVLAVLRNDLNHKASVSLFIREYHLLPVETLREIQQTRDAYQKVISDAIERGKAADDFHSPLPSNVIAFGIIGMCAWAIHWYNAQGSLSVEKLGEGYAEMILTGLRVP